MKVFGLQPADVYRFRLLAIVIMRAGTEIEGAHEQRT